jgi:hypothetical protein
MIRDFPSQCGHSPGQRCHSCPLQRGRGPASVSGCAFSPAGRGNNTHLDHIRPQHQAGLDVAHGSLGAALAARGDAVDGGGAAVRVVLLEPVRQREFRRECGSRHAGLG